jgi:teichuronic acid biosynthesis glycosyltransferase TuaC
VRTFKPRLAVITSLFPIREEPYRGQPIYQTVLALQQFADIKVFCPMAVYPPGFRPASYVYRRADRSYAPPGAPVEYLEYLTVPVFGRRWNGFSSGRAAYRHVREFRPDLVLSYWLYPDGAGAVAIANRLGVPVVVGSRGSDLLKIPDRVTLQADAHRCLGGTHGQPGTDAEGNRARCFSW